jgi:hypothetical protein
VSKDNPTGYRHGLAPYDKVDVAREILASPIKPYITSKHDCELSSGKNADGSLWVYCNKCKIRWNNPTPQQIADHIQLHLTYEPDTDDPDCLTIAMRAFEKVLLDAKE